MKLFSTLTMLAVGGTVLLLVPAPQWYGSKVAYRTIEYLEVARRNASWWRFWRRLLRMPHHWVELARSALGVGCLLAVLKAWRADPALVANSAPMWLRDESAVGIAALGLILMLAVFRKTDGLLAPVVFVAGVTVVVAPWPVAVMTLVLALAVMIATRLLAMFFAVLALSLLGVGFLLTKNLVLVGVLAGFAFCPVMIALLRSRELVLPVRRSRAEIDER